jgi:carboxylesterase
VHKEHKQIVNGAEKAVLLVHGIVGTPNHFAPLLPLIPDGVSVHNLLLDGHGKGVKEFSKTSMKIWENQVRTAAEALTRTHKKVYIVGHSLGSLLAIDAAMQNPRICKLFLLAVPLHLLIKPRMFQTAWRVNTGKIDPKDPVAVAAQACCGVTPSRNLLLYLGWIPRYLELFAKIRKTRKQLPKLETACLAFQSAKDEMVSLRAAQLLAKSPCVCVGMLKHSGHYYYEERDLLQLKEAFSQWIAGEDADL